MRKKPSQLQLYRIKKGVLAVEVAKALKIDSGNYSKIESGWVSLKPGYREKIVKIIDRLSRR